MRIFLAVICLCSSALATPILLSDQQLEPPLESRADLDLTPLESVLDERVPLSALERFGVVVQTSGLDGRIRMEVVPTEEIVPPMPVLFVQSVLGFKKAEEPLGSFRLEWQPEKGWVSLSGEVVTGWNAPILRDGIIFVPIKCLGKLGFDLNVLESGIQVRSTFAQNTLPVGGLNQILEIKSQKGRSSRVSLSFARAAEFFVTEKTTAKFRLKFANTATQPKFQAVGSESLSRVRVLRSGKDAILEAEIPFGATLEVSANGKEVFIDTTEIGLPLPLVPTVLPTGVSYTITPVGLSKLHLIRLEPSLYRPEVQTAPWGGAKSILEYGGTTIAAVNGGYFDPSSMQAVDLLFTGNIQAYSRGNRATIGFIDNTMLFGIPRARLVLSMGATTANINQIRPVPHPQNLTFFIGDDFVPVGGLGFTTFVLANGKILERRDDAFVPKTGQITVTFNPKTNPSFERKVGDDASVALNWSDAAWQNTSSAIAAGPRLIANGVYAVNPQAEGFDPNSEIWRPTRQIGIGMDTTGKYVLAMLELASPEDFAKALLAQGLRDAIRLDSGTSAQMTLMGGAVGGRISRAIPNAIVFKARE